jgi:hypothetical protein
MSKRTVLFRPDGIVFDIVMPGPGWEKPEGVQAVESETANIGDSYDKGKFIPRQFDWSKDELKEYVHLRRGAAVKQAMEFNLSDPGQTPKLIKIQMGPEQLAEIRELDWVAEVTGEEVTLVTKDGVLTMTPHEIARLHMGIAKFIQRSHKIAAALLEGIDKNTIPSRREIDAPETATATKIPSWTKNV